jgi:transposase-like protein
MREQCADIQAIDMLMSASDHSTNPLERLNREVKRRTNVVGIFPNEAGIRRLAGAVLMEQNDGWIQGNCYMTLETMAELNKPPEQTATTLLN